MDKGVACNYRGPITADSDLKISWSAGVYTEDCASPSKSKFLITLSTGKRYNGRMDSVDSLHAND